MTQKERSRVQSEAELKTNAHSYRHNQCIGYLLAQMCFGQRIRKQIHIVFVIKDHNNRGKNPHFVAAFKVQQIFRNVKVPLILTEQ